MRLRKLTLLVDSAFANMGVAVWDSTGRQFVYLDCLSTKPMAKKNNTYVVDDNSLRCMALAAGLVTIMEQYAPGLIVAEFPHGGGKSSKAVAAMAMSVAVVSTIALCFATKLLPVQPLQTKLVVGGKSSTSKEDIQNFILAKYGDCATESGKRLSKHSGREHIADAMALVSVVELQYPALL